MLLHMRKDSKIENPRAYAEYAVDGLRCLLATGGQVQPDPNRNHFYQLEDDKSTYYIHVSPITGNVILLAKWARQPEGCYAGAGNLFA